MQSILKAFFSVFLQQDCTEDKQEHDPNATKQGLNIKKRKMTEEQDQNDQGVSKIEKNKKIMVYTPRKKKGHKTKS